MEFGDGLADLGLQAAGAVVRSMDVDTVWDRVKQVVAVVLGRGRDEDVIECESRLERDRATLTAAEPAARVELMDELTAEWRVRLKDALSRDPALAGQLRGLLTEIEPQMLAAGGAGTQTVRQKASGHGRNYAAGRDINIGRKTN